MLFNEPKLLKCDGDGGAARVRQRFSALQRAEIAEIIHRRAKPTIVVGFSALQRAEIAEMMRLGYCVCVQVRFSALQRAEIAEMGYNEMGQAMKDAFQCSSTSRNC